MAGDDPSRFDYLFEPIDGDTESAADGDIEAIVVVPVRSGKNRRWSWLAVVAAAIVGVGIGLIALWSSPVEAVQVPSSVTTLAPPGPVATSSPVVAPASGSVPLPPPAPPPPPAPEPTVSIVPEPEPEPRQAPPAAPSTSAAPAARPPTPTVRSPMSVSPVPRPAFPDQQIPDGDGPRGGLLGGGGLL